MMMKSKLSAVFVSLLVSACAAQPGTTPDPIAQSGTQTKSNTKTSCVAPGTWYDPGDGKTISTQTILRRTKNTDVVLLGETHVIADHHRWQLQTLAQLYAQRPDMILGFEAFPRRVQPALNQWVKGTLSETEFLKQSDWNTVWKFDPKLYMPLFHFARLNRIPMVALNIDKKLIRNVSENGWNGVAQVDRLGLGEPNTPSPKYVNILTQSFGQHSFTAQKSVMNSNRLGRFIDVQVTWDLAMAEATKTALAAAKAQGRNPQMVNIIGRGHMDYGFGVPQQLAALGIDNVFVLEPWEDLRPCSKLTLQNGPAVANAVFGLNISEKDFVNPTPKPRLGVLIENNETGGVRIDGVLKSSVAKTAGLLKGDIILTAADHTITKTDELVTIIQAMNPGTWLPLTVRRKDKMINIIARFPVKLKDVHHP